jgi:RimJ/RimL family protein N-acetyltransferase
VIQFDGPRHSLIFRQPIGFTFARSHQGKGLAFEATCLVLDYLFTELRLHRVIAIADCENERSVALLERLGMRREGHFIQNIWLKGNWGDEYLYAILKEEWLSNRQQLVGSQ